MKTQDDLVNYIETTASKINRIFVKLLSRKESMGIVDSDLRCDVLFNVNGLRNSIDEFNEVYRQNASDALCEKIDTIDQKLTSEQPPILDPIE